MTLPTPELLRAFEARDLDPAAFHHRDHIAVAFELLRRHEFLEAANRYGTGIRSLAARAGAADKFNATVTLAFLSIIAERMRAADYADAEDFIARNPDLFSRALLTRWYAPDRLASDLARQVFLLPEAAR